MTATNSPVRTVLFPLTPRLVEVVEIEDVTPAYRRITLAGDQLEGFQSLDAGDHIKLAVPNPGEDAPALPVIGPNGIRYPEGAQRPVLRDYTPRRFDAERKRLVLDFVLHGDGPASTWAAQAAPGQKVGVLGPRGSHIVDSVFDWYLMLGDETVLPEIARRLEEATAGLKIHAFVEVDSAADVQELPTAADVEIHWVFRNGVPPGTSSVLEAALRGFAFPEGTFFTWAGGEANTLRSIRRYLVRERGIAPELASFSGHWKKGVADHDHHEPIED